MHKKLHAPACLESKRKALNFEILLPRLKTFSSKLLIKEQCTLKSVFYPLKVETRNCHIRLVNELSSPGQFSIKVTIP